jgi:peptidoglycan/xylan/chitin deacetylase (PgdA/CDA1 family)
MITKKLIQRSKWLARDVSYSLGLSSLHTEELGCRVLMYHGIDLHGKTDFNTRFISAEYFEKQIAYFSKYFNILSLTDVYEKRFSKDKLNIAITFDDGYLNNLKYAIPILEKYQAPATFFITGIRDAGMDILWPDFVDMASIKFKGTVEIEGRVFKKNRKGELASNGQTLKQICKSKPWVYKVKMMNQLQHMNVFKQDSDLIDYWKQLTVEQIKELSNSPIATIGSHGYYHNNLGCVDSKSATNELVDSKSFLEDLIQKPITAIAYPDGSYTEEVKEIAYGQGYTEQLAVEYLFESDSNDSRILDRFGVNPFISWNNQLHCLMQNSYW